MTVDTILRYSIMTNEVFVEANDIEMLRKSNTFQLLFLRLIIDYDRLRWIIIQAHLKKYSGPSIYANSWSKVQKHLQKLHAT